MGLTFLPPTPKSSSTGSGPFRSSDWVGRCARCNGPTSDACSRCALPLCTYHQPAPGHRCHHCEVEYHSRSSRFIGRDLPMAVLFLTIAAMMSAGLFPLIGDLVALPVLLLCAFALQNDNIVGRSIEASRRRRFLGESKKATGPGRLLGASTSE